MSFVKYTRYRKSALFVFFILFSNIAISAPWKAYFPDVNGSTFISDDPIVACSQVNEYMTWSYPGISLAYGAAWSSQGEPYMYPNYEIPIPILHCQLFAFDDGGGLCGIGGDWGTENWHPFRCQDFAVLEIVEDEREAGDPPCRMKNGSNPIHTASGNKYQREVDFNGISDGTLKLDRHYNSLFTFPGSFGSNWRGKYDRALLRENNKSVILIRHDGKLLKLPYNRKNNRYELHESELNYSVTSENNGWLLRLPGDVTEQYDASGRLLTISNKQFTEKIVYAQEQPAISMLSGISRIDRIEDSNGRSLVFSYDSGGFVSEVLSPDGSNIRYEYKKQLLSKVIYSSSEGESVSREYVYDNPNHPNSLTGIIDERGVRYATWRYDEQGRAISSEHANGADRTQLNYNDDGTTTVVNPLGKQTTYHFETFHGVRQVVQIEGHPTSTCDGVSRLYRYNDDGFLASKTDWKGNTINYTRDRKGRELSRIEAVGTPRERTVTTVWHANLDRPVSVSEPGKVINYRYDEHGNLIERTMSPQDVPDTD
jgi:YD repeat-containing protein